MFTLNSVVPWGRNIDEYREMFCLTDEDMKKNIAGFGDGPAAFNVQALKQGYHATSFDPIYAFSAEQIRRRIEETRITVMQQTRENAEHYNWTKIKSPDELEKRRMQAMEMFLADYEKGKAEKRYICHSMPDRLDLDDDYFDLGLSSHFLFMYADLGLDFHINAIRSMLRVCREVRIFPTVDLNGNESGLVPKVAEYFKGKYSVSILPTSYDFQKGGNMLLTIQK